MFTVEKAGVIYGAFNSDLSGYVLLERLVLRLTVMFHIAATASDNIRHTSFEVPVGRTNMLVSILG